MFIFHEKVTAAFPDGVAVDKNTFGTCGHRLAVFLATRTFVSLGVFSFRRPL
jgi:hypothetical protein